MVTVERNVRPEEVRQAAKHTLYVEGKDDSALDPTVLRELLPSALTIVPMGPSFYIRSVAEALYKHHPFYYFLVDRDHYDDEFVKSCWEKFPDPQTCNLLVWHRRELENYFIAPDYLVKSQYLTCGTDRLHDVVLKCCRERLYYDAANQVIVTVREDLKRCDLPLFPKVRELPTEKTALMRLIEAIEPAHKQAGSLKRIGRRAVKQRFFDTLDQLKGGKSGLEYGSGRWLDLLRGKAILPTVINKCFRVLDARGAALQGKDRVMEVAKDLVRRDLNEQPADFQRLHQTILDRIQNA
jgi:hypothetical protein